MASGAVCTGSSYFPEIKKEADDPGTEEKFELSVSGCTEFSSVWQFRQDILWKMQFLHVPGIWKDFIPKTQYILKEFHYMESQLKVSVPVEELFLGFAERCCLEDVENFAAVFHTAKRTGGDMNADHSDRSARMLGDKIDVKKEIESTLAAKKAEQTIMSRDAGRNYSVI